MVTYYSNRKLTDILVQEKIEGRIAEPAASITLSSKIYMYNTYTYMYTFFLQLLYVWGVMGRIGRG